MGSFLVYKLQHTYFRSKYKRSNEFGPSHVMSLFKSVVLPMDSGSGNYSWEFAGSVCCCFLLGSLIISGYLYCRDNWIRGCGKQEVNGMLDVDQ